jgi:hypothetical protein
MKLYHITSEKNAKNIIKNGLNSHSWLATNKKRCEVYRQRNKSYGLGNQLILVFNISNTEIKKRTMVYQETLVGFEYLLHSHKLPKLNPVEIKI